MSYYEYRNVFSSNLSIVIYKLQHFITSLFLSFFFLIYKNKSFVNNFREKLNFWSSFPNYQSSFSNFQWKHQYSKLKTMEKNGKHLNYAEFRHQHESFGSAKVRFQNFIIKVTRQKQQNSISGNKDFCVSKSSLFITESMH